MIPDTHAHLDMLEGPPEEAVARAREAGVSPVVTIGIDLLSSRKAVEMAGAVPGVFASVGIHPNDASQWSPASMDEIARLARNERVVAIGESGLDYYRDSAPVALQAESFRAHIRLANALGKALIVHDREAHSDTLDILKVEGAGGAPVILHCFSGDESVLARCLAAGYYISFAGPVTFKNAGATRELAALVPEDRLLAETDAPFLSPHPFRGKPNLPERVRLVAHALAMARGLEPEELDASLRRNAAAAFGFPEGE